MAANTNEPGWWLVIPAAGRGSRMGLTFPKQYLDLDGRSMLDVTLSRFLAVPGLRGIVLALAADDKADRPRLPDAVRFEVVEGGATRADTVRRALVFLADDDEVGADDWVMVHDAARPCVRPADVERLVQQAVPHGGGLLAAPVRDTLKRADASGCVAETIDRRGAMHALTPQLFPLQSLLSALVAAERAGVEITDESSAMEARGFRPLLVEGHADNIKLTHPADLPLVRLILQAQGLLSAGVSPVDSTGQEVS